MAFQTRASQRVVLATELREATASVAPSQASRSHHGTTTPAPTARPQPEGWTLFPPPSETPTQISTSSFVTFNHSINSRSDASASLNHPDFHSQSAADLSINSPNEYDDDYDEEDAELDMLDSHLADFRTLPNMTSPLSATVLPAHDGLGTFRLPDTSNIQEQLYAFEQFNPNGVHSLPSESAPIELDPEEIEAAERRARIEAWRLEHSRVLLEEIQKETRRQRRMSQVSSARAKKSATTTASVQSETIGEESAATAPQAEESEKMEWHENSADDRTKAAQEDDDEPKGFLDRITHKVIRDMLDLDDHTLAIIFGETYVGDENDDLATPRPSSPTGDKTATDAAAAKEDSSWQLRIIEGVARELGVFVNSVSPHPHPGAFSTYNRVNQDPLPYAGLDAIPETASSTPKRPMSLLESLSQSAMQFKPSFTLLQSSTPAAVTPTPTPDEAAEKTAGAAPTADAATTAAKGQSPARSERFTQEEWEKDLDIKLVFRYLRSRFAPGQMSSPASVSSSHTAMLNPQESAAKAARIRQHHPLIGGGGRVPADRRAFKATAPGSPVALRHGSNCSQSTRRSARRSSASSRHYWDIGGSIGTGSVVATATATNGPMGSWAEV